MPVNWKKTTRFQGPEESPGFLLWQVSTQWRRKIEEALAEVELTHPQFVLLASVGWLGAVSQANLARHCKTDITMTSQVLRSLEKKGLIERYQNEGNAKTKLSRVTKQGAQLIERTIPLVEEVDALFFSPLKKEEKHLVKLLQELLCVTG